MKTPRDKNAALLAEASFASTAPSRPAPRPSSVPSSLVTLDPVIHERVRLVLLTALSTADESTLSFQALRETLQLTDGNLMGHIRALEQAGLVERSKQGAGRGSLTLVRLSAQGKRAFSEYLGRLETLIKTARGDEK